MRTVSIKIRKYIRKINGHRIDFRKIPVGINDALLNIKIDKSKKTGKIEGPSKAAQAGLLDFSAAKGPLGELRSLRSIAKARDGYKVLNSNVYDKFKAGYPVRLMSITGEYRDLINDRLGKMKKTIYHLPDIKFDFKKVDKFRKK